MVESDAVGNGLAGYDGVGRVCCGGVDGWEVAGEGCLVGRCWGEVKLPKSGGCGSGSA